MVVSIIFLMEYLPNHLSCRMLSGSMHIISALRPCVIFDPARKYSPFEQYLRPHFSGEEIPKKYLRASARVAITRFDTSCFERVHVRGSGLFKYITYKVERKHILIKVQRTPSFI